MSQEPKFIDLLTLHLHEVFGVRNVREEQHPSGVLSGVYKVHLNMCKNPCPKTVKSEPCRGMHYWWEVPIHVLSDTKVEIDNTCFHAAEPDCFDRIDAKIREMNEMNK